MLFGGDSDGVGSGEVSARNPKLKCSLCSNNSAHPGHFNFGFRAQVGGPEHSPKERFLAGTPGPQPCGRNTSVCLVFLRKDIVVRRFQIHRGYVLRAALLALRKNRRRNHLRFYRRVTAEPRGRGLEVGHHFPLTPALSPGRGRMVRRLGCSLRFQWFERLKVIEKVICRILRIGRCQWSYASQSDKVGAFRDADLDRLRG